MKKQILSEEFLRMQKLAGLINESNEQFTPENNVNFKWNVKPLNPQDMLTSEDGETFTKENFWESDIIGTDPSLVFPNYGNKNNDGTWTLTFDEGEISGFVEGEDFTL